MVGTTTLTAGFGHLGALGGIGDLHISVHRGVAIAIISTLRGAAIADRLPSLAIDVLIGAILKMIAVADDMGFDQACHTASRGTPVRGLGTEIVIA